LNFRLSARTLPQVAVASGAKVRTVILPAPSGVGIRNRFVPVYAGNRIKPNVGAGSLGQVGRRGSPQAG
jgi:hypothetical protein